ncbi:MULTISPECIES: hypothetical protein [unclassified Nocardioides]|uniref:hypothetical protein n=1 Tax=unclassified Nocardioides TaxID=2615069 RepID=UPI0006F2B93C|nr:MULTISPECIES: hypothetical protein [unclassified Nocardioides]KQY54464.1 hypothetical protein ASD30_17565 [Nocardioides sp. Root140]KQZ66340.1 hypothetical protein ASD66_22645 [Nocardioides sp. Root151]KRF19540.1 hypothetical protein ASH02_23525 [Nocardioides sp. Soil796]
MEINGLPAHPLIIHAAVVLVPVAAVLAATYAVVPRWRWSTRWPMVGAQTAALIAVLAAWFSGRNLKASMVDAGANADRFRFHQEQANILFWVTIVFFFVVLLGAWALGGPSALVSGRGARGKHAPIIEWTMVSMLVIFAIAAIATTFQTGEQGARLVWGG